MITTDTIKETNYYKGLSFINQKIVRAKENVKKLDHSLNVIKELGIEKWEIQTKPSFVNKQIIIELLG